jgi:hypothetical protein
LGGACLGAREVLLKGRAVIGNGSIFQEMRPEDKMTTIYKVVALLFYHSPHFFFNNDDGRG